MEPVEILREVTGPQRFQADDCVKGRGDYLGRVISVDGLGDVMVRWEDGEEWKYPPSFLTLVLVPPAPVEPMPPPPPDTELPNPLDAAFGAFPDFPLEGEVRLIDETTGAQKGMKPERFELLPWDALAEVARVYAYGAKKYEARNWEKGYPWTWSFSAACRHLWRWMCGETFDPETGLHHAAHACFHCLAMVAYSLRNVGTDDRP